VLPLALVSASRELLVAVSGLAMVDQRRSPMATDTEV
jgi:hypothetical protein